jgi:hypothetical protein
MGSDIGKLHHTPDPTNAAQGPQSRRRGFD